MNNDEKHLAQQLRLIDSPPSFDADAFSERVIATRSRRRNRRVVSGSCAMIATLLAGLVWQSFHDTEPQVVNEDPAAGVAPVDDQYPPNEQTDRNVHTSLAEFKQQQQQLDSLLTRIENAGAAMAANRTERHDQLLALYRAAVSSDIEVPDLSHRSLGMVGDPTN